MSKIRNPLPSSIEISNLFEYFNGALISKYSRTNRIAGSSVGRITKHGYKSVKIGKKQFYEHRLIWMLFNSNLHGLDVDHINGNRSDNRIENLRLATRTENNRNLHSAKCNSKTGLLGACFHKKTGKFVAQIRSNGKYLHLGLFDTAQLAHETYMNAKTIYHPSVKE